MLSLGSFIALKFGQENNTHHRSQTSIHPENVQRSVLSLVKVRDFGIITILCSTKFWKLKALPGIRSEGTECVSWVASHDDGARSFYSRVLHAQVGAGIAKWREPMSREHDGKKSQSTLRPIEKEVLRARAFCSKTYTKYLGIWALSHRQMLNLANF